jgi:sugar/nucleoside kinase (ribokinase family)
LIPFKTEKPILCIGDACPDIILPYSETGQFLSTVASGEAVNAEQKSAVVMAGGSVGNTAHGIAALGGKVWFAGKVGNDYYGRFLHQTFEDAGVDSHLLRMDPGIPTSMVIVVVDAARGRIPFVVPRTHASQHQLEKEDLPSGLLDQIGWLHTSGILMRENPAAETILELMEECIHRGIPVSLDLNLRIEAIGDPECLRRTHRAMDCCNLLFGSGKDELIPVSGQTSPEAAARALVTPDRVVVCRAGAQGADVYSVEGGVQHCDAFKVPLVDTLGAGDAYNAGFITAAAEGLSLAEANLRANAVAGYKVMYFGARNFPERNALEKFMLQAGQSKE